MHDIYDPPPAPVAWTPPKPEPLHLTVGDYLYLAVFGVPLLAASAWAFSIEPTVGVFMTVGGLFVVLESWFSALTFLHRRPASEPGGRWMIFLAAMVPWLVGLGVAAALMYGLFLAADWAG